MNTPNKLTIARIFMVPIFIALFYFYRESYISGIIFTLASLTDLLDGYLARKNNQITDFGKFMDPLADKILVLSALVIFVDQRLISPIAVIIVIFREFTISGFRLIAAKKGCTIAAGKSGKLKTLLQLIGIIMVLFSHNITELEPFLKIGQYIIYASVLVAIYSLIIYIKKNYNILYGEQSE